jgi:pentose-5-phosphate-3-epimerase
MAENKRNIKIAPSVLSADFARLADSIKAVEEAGADLIHLDIMEGISCPISLSDRAWWRQSAKSPGCLWMST